MKFLRLKPYFIIIFCILLCLNYSAASANVEDTIVIPDGPYEDSVQAMNQDNPVVNIIPDSLSLDLQLGQTKDLYVTILPEDATDSTPIWGLADGGGGILSLEPHGDYCTINSIKPGLAIIRVSTMNGKCALITVTVEPVQVKNIMLTAKSTNITCGKSLIINASVFPDNATNKQIIWQVTEGRDLVDLSYGGNLCKIRGIKPGNVCISASTPDGTIISQYVVKISHLYVPNIFGGNIFNSAGKVLVTLSILFFSLALIILVSSWIVRAIRIRKYRKQ